MPLVIGYQREAMRERDRSDCDICHAQRLALHPPLPEKIARQFGCVPSHVIKLQAPEESFCFRLLTIPM